MSNAFEPNPATIATTQSTSPWIVAGGGTAGTPGTAVLTVQGVASGTPQPVAVQPNTTSVNVFTSLATAGALVKTGAATALSLQWVNNTGAPLIPMLFDATTTRTNGSVPFYVGSSTANGAFTNISNIGASLYGLSFSTGIWQQLSTTALTMTSGASTAVTGYVTYV